MLTWRNFNPPYFTVIWMLDEHASKLFSMSSFNALAGRRIISPAAIRFTTTASSLLITPGSNCPLPSMLAAIKFYLWCYARQTLTFNLPFTGCFVDMQRTSSVKSYAAAAASFYKLSKSYVVASISPHTITTQIIHAEQQWHGKTQAANTQTHTHRCRPDEWRSDITSQHLHTRS